MTKSELEIQNRKLSEALEDSRNVISALQEEVGNMEIELDEMRTARAEEISAAVEGAHKLASCYPGHSVNPSDCPACAVLSEVSR